MNPMENRFFVITVDGSAAVATVVNGFGRIR